MSADVSLLVFYLMLALGVSFACSIFEAVLLSITPGYVAALEKEGSPAAARITALKGSIDRPMAAILSLNTIAHTVGAAGVGAQSAKVFVSVPMGAISGVLTVLILFVSEIVPKSLGATNWKKLAPAVAAALIPVTFVMTYTGFVPVSNWVTRKLGGGKHGTEPSREEISAIAERGAQRGLFAASEGRVLNNLFRLGEVRATDVMTPRTVVFALPEAETVGALIERDEPFRFSRIPIHQGTLDQVTGYVLRSDILLAAARDELDTPLSKLRRDLKTVGDELPLSDLLEQLLEQQTHMALVIDAHGTSTGLVTLEDVVETLFGTEIIDEADNVADLRELARKKWQERAKRLGMVDDGEPSE
ncbi:MAG: CNNM domain-containing protein [Nannocystaceae bacterium]|nr:hemolysin family protein [bacterium]